MTDKQIIIDGVDVSGCRYLFDDTSYKRSKTSCSITLKDCKYLDNNCYYKQLKRKERECEELKKIINEAKNSKLDLKSFLVGEAVQNEYEQQLHKLKVENNKLKEELEAVYDNCKGCPTCNETLYNANLYAKEYRKLKQTLTEIKEIAEPYKMTINKICGNCKKYDDCHACCYKDINCYKYTSSKTNACEEFTYLDELVLNLLANNILQKISECEVEDDRN